MSLEVPRDAKFRGAESSECQEQEDTDVAQLLCLPGVGFGSTCHLQENISRLGGALEARGEMILTNTLCFAVV